MGVGSVPLDFLARVLHYGVWFVRFSCGKGTGSPVPFRCPHLAASRVFFEAWTKHAWRFGRLMGETEAIELEMVNVSAALFTPMGRVQSEFSNSFGPCVSIRPGGFRGRVVFSGAGLFS